jgi:dihydrofolate reductase
MNDPKISLVVAAAKNLAIGKDNKLLWSIPEDMKRFREITNHKPVIMGRKTWESIPERFRPLPNRTNIIITRQKEYRTPSDVITASSLEEALRKTTTANEVMIIGGGELYKEGMGLANKLYITHVDQTVDGDTFFPSINPTLWKETSHDKHDGFTFSIYERI